MKRLTLPLLLALLILLPLKAKAYEVTVSDLTGLNDAQIAIKSVPDINSTIWVSDTIMIDRAYTVKGNGKKVTIKRAAGFVGDMFSVGAGGTLSLQDVVLDGNKEKVKSAAGAIINNAGTVTLRGGVTIRNNYRVNSAQGGANGGAVVNTGVLNVRGGEISGNYAQSGGGAIFNFGGKVIILGDCVIKDNYARLGGGICNTDNGRITLSGNTLVSGNSAYQGGGIMNAGENARLMLSGNALITENTADYGTGVMNTSELRLSGKVQIGTGEEDNGLYLGLYQTAASSSKAEITSAYLKEGARINLEGGINHEGDGLILVVQKSYRGSMKYFYCRNPEYELTVTEKGSLVLKQKAVTVVSGGGWEKQFLIEAKTKDLKNVVLNNTLTLGVQYTLTEKNGVLTITLKDSYLNRLGNGRLFIRFQFIDGKAECIFENGSSE